MESTFMMNWRRPTPKYFMHIMTSLHIYSHNGIIPYTSIVVVIDGYLKDKIAVLDFRQNNSFTLKKAHPPLTAAIK